MWFRTAGYEKEMLINTANVTTVEQRDRDGEESLKIYFIGGGATVIPGTLDDIEVIVAREAWKG